ncbi:XRE family transcriptional regulator [Lactococcus lactis]|uniref:helix-turn-helix domain-containing protein n=1 Tax=Lactococcus lactis TaxID=1358 RepID=UPI00223A8E95|nr:helix-turn-helix transcriptional regulator [Lactococcus lactis]MCT1191657.1 XRE family transcriptional regulator [Lactococcus lactis]MDG4986998.1 helix-turn-helix domain-containing protein [Lactococcus lactis]
MKEKVLFFDRFILQVRKSNKSINAIEKELGYPRNSLNNYKNGGEPSGSRLVEIAEYFNVSPEFLIGKEKNSTIAEEFNILPKEYFRQLRESQKKELVLIITKWIIDEFVMDEK